LFIKYSVLAIIVVFYVVYTLRFSLHFYKSILFNGLVKGFHLTMFWLVPFIWIYLVKNLIKPTPGSREFEHKESPESSTECGLGIWMDPNTGD